LKISDTVGAGRRLTVNVTGEIISKLETQGIVFRRKIFKRLPSLEIAFLDRSNLFSHHFDVSKISSEPENTTLERGGMDALKREASLQLFT